MATVLLAVFMLIVIRHWWEMRLALSMVHDGLLSVAWTAASFIPSLEGMDTRKTLVRYAHAVHELLWKAKDGDDENGDEGSEELVTLGFLTHSESSALRGDAQPAFILVHWMTSVVLRAKTQGLIVSGGDAALTQFLAAFDDLKKGSQTIHTLVNTKHAHPLTQLLSVVVFFALAMFSMEMGQNAGSEQIQGHEAWMVFDAGMIFVVHLFYHVSVLVLKDVIITTIFIPRSFSHHFDCSLVLSHALLFFHSVSLHSTTISYTSFNLYICPLLFTYYSCSSYFILFIYLFIYLL